MNLWTPSSRKGYILVLALVFAAYQGAYAQARPAKPAAPPATQPAADLGETSTAPTGFMQVFKPEAGLLYNPNFPMGDVGSVLNPSFGTFSLYGEVTMPQKFLDLAMLPLSKFNLVMRNGLTIGFSSYSTDESLPNSGSATVVPILVHTKVVFPIKLIPMMTLEPYGRLDFGMSFVSASASGAANVDESNVDGSFGIGVGSAFLIKPLMAFKVIPYLELKYLYTAEELSGQFFTISIGAGYRF
jgi:hypothetical protein